MHSRDNISGIIGAGSGVYMGFLGAITPSAFPVEILKTIMLAAIGWATTTFCKWAYNQARLKLRR